MQILWYNAQASQMFSLERTAKIVDAQTTLRVIQKQRKPVLKESGREIHAAVFKMCHSNGEAETLEREFNMIRTKVF